MFIHSVTEDCPKCVDVNRRWLSPGHRKSKRQHRGPQQNAQAEKKPLAGACVSPVILRDKVAIRKVIAVNGIPQL